MRKFSKGGNPDGIRHTSDATRAGRFCSHWLPVIVWCVIIFVQSHSAVSKQLPDWPLFDKFLHAGAYALLGFLVCRAFYTLPGWGGNPLRLILTGTAITFLYGISDEWHQSLIPARIPSAADLLADLIGGFAGSLAFWWFRRRAGSF